MVFNDLSIRTANTYNVSCSFYFILKLIANIHLRTSSHNSTAPSDSKHPESCISRTGSAGGLYSDLTCPTHQVPPMASATMLDLF